MFRQVLLPLLILLTIHLSGQKTARMTLVDTIPSVDGVIEDHWDDQISIETFTQLEPVNGAPSVEPTGVLILQDEENLYFGFKCYQETPVTAKITMRDRLGKEDDGILITLGTFNDHRTSYGFLVYPLGTQVDLRIAEDGAVYDINLDLVWEAAAKIYDWGYIIEVSIPFRSLQYNRKAEAWDLNLGRSIARLPETSYWSGALTEDFRISQGGALVGIQPPPKRSKLAIYPYARGNYERSTETGKKGKFDGTAGGDIQWQINSNITANVTANPDFATVEGDAEQVNLTRYELSYPEKRLFFLEGNDMFSTRIQTFYSRRIGDIFYGAKVKGKAGKYSFNGIHTYAMDIPEANEPRAFYTVGTVRRDILKASSVGLIVADKSSDSGYARSASLDYTLNLGDTWKLTGQAVVSAPGDLASHSAFFLRFARENNIYHYHIRYTNIGKNFQDNVNQTGFVVDDDRQELDGDFSYKWWIRNNTVRYVRVLAANNIFWSHTGELRSWYLTYLANIYFENKFSFEVLYNNEYKLFDKGYYNHKWGLEAGYNTDEWSHARLNFLWGRNFDRDFWLLTGTTWFKISDKFAVEYRGDLLRFSPDPTESSAFINRLSLIYNFTRDLWVKLFIQNNTANNRIYYYGMAGWRFKPPFGAVYLIVNHDEFNYLPDDEFRHETIIYLKLTYPILF